MEKNFTAVERLLFYERSLKRNEERLSQNAIMNNNDSINDDNKTDKENDDEKLIDTEAIQINPNYRKPNNWPSTGKIVFKNLKMRYRTDLDWVLRGLNITINPGDKVGICGRTGAGKSSLLLCLFRLVEPDESSQLLIDDIDCMKLGLRDLRSSISIIPQDPVLFSGSIRFNLDPFNERSDDDVIKILKQVKLYNKIVSSSDNLINMDPLQYVVAEGGSNFSQGQKQLICIARALLRNSKILALDEATSSVDQKTDKLIQDLIRTSFKNQTVLTIAHRLETIIDYDKLIVLKQGKVVEYDSPQNLLKNKKGLFYEMYHFDDDNSNKN